MIINKCLKCSQPTKPIFPSVIKRGGGKFCSITCSTGYYNKFRTNKNAAHWKGNNISYSGIHMWIRNKFGKANKCSNNTCLGKSNNFEWANISGKYLRDISDWKQLCCSCHRKFDETPEKIEAFRQRMTGRPAWNNVGLTKNCRQCIKVFNVSPSRKSHKLYCSLECYRKYIFIKRTKVCPTCSKVFLDKRSLNRKYCCFKCYIAHKLSRTQLIK